METLFGNDNPKLLAAMNKFIIKVFELNTFYTWPHVLEVAISWHIRVAASNILNINSWAAMPESYYKSLLADPSAIRSIKRARSELTLRSPIKRGSPEACRSFNKGTCERASCRYAHKCLRCGLSGHGEHTCKK